MQSFKGRAIAVGWDYWEDQLVASRRVSNRVSVYDTDAIVKDYSIRRLTRIVQRRTGDRNAGSTIANSKKLLITEECLHPVLLVIVLKSRLYFVWHYARISLTTRP
jgi:hypothetical protein